MQSKTMLQTIGTVSSLILAYIALEATPMILPFYEPHTTNVLLKNLGFAFPILSVLFMLTTGLSYYDSRIEHEGSTRFLYFLVALAHIVLAPFALVIALFQVPFDQYWGFVLIGMFVFISWSIQPTGSEKE